ncbi:MAG: ABC transporter permease [Coriobacteriales bacterium]|jgi:ABC-2 type transport system permease protein|nr:ABC transporter permease [Coriobacteriales bacterium]
MGAINICKRIIVQAYKNKTLFILLFVPIISFLISALISMPSDSKVRIGIIDEDRTDMSATLIKMMEKNDSFELSTDISDVDEMKVMLKNQDIVIGMRINDGLYDNLEKKGAIQLFQTYDIETFKLVELYMNSSIDNIILIKKSTMSQNELVKVLNKYVENDSLKVNLLTDEKAKGVFSSTAFGFLTMFMLLVSVLSSKLIADDRFNTTIKRIFMSPVRKSSYILAGFLANFIFQLIQVAVILAICLIMDFQFPIPMYSVAVIFVMFSVFASFFGMFIGFISKSVNQMLIMSQLFMLPGLLLCGTFFEFSLMPEWLQKISFVFPQTWISQAANHFTNGLSDVYFIQMAGYFAVLCVLIGAYLMVIFKKKKVNAFY